VREVRMALLAADVNYQVAKDLCEEVRQKCLGAEVLASIRPGDQFVKIFHDELVRVLGDGVREVALVRPLRILLCGLNGAGKTTAAAKLALWFKNQRQNVVLVAGDLARPAAIEQLKILGAQIGVTVLTWPDAKSVQEVARRGREEAERLRAEVVIFDAAGRLDADEALLAELAEVGKVWEPQETLLVADAATGQTAVSVAQAFQARVPVTGLILSKFDADTRGGAALSFQRTAQVPIKFLGTGEKPKDLEVFAPERLAGRILGMGDVVGLVERAQEQFDLQSMEKLKEKIKRNSFDLQDFCDQLSMMEKMGPLQNLLGMLPGMGNLNISAGDEKRLGRIKAMISSMTPGERRRPEILNARRRQRIARGSGRSVSELNELLQRFAEMKKMMARLTRSGNPEQHLKKLLGRR
jgi:signal recognition particle subunit SRP54